MRLFRVLICLFIALVFSGCPAETESPWGPTSALTADIQEPLLGVADRGADPAVVGVGVGGAIVCAGVLVAPDAVLTAKHCVSAPTGAAPCGATSAFEALAPSSLPSLDILVGEEDATAQTRAHVRGVIVPGGDPQCRWDIAVLQLDRALDDIQPLTVRSTGVALGDHVRTVGFASGRSSGPRVGATKWVRDHAKVTAASPSLFRIQEGGCDNGCGGPAIDEASGTLVGIVSWHGPATDGGPDHGGADHDVATQTSAVLGFIDGALQATPPRGRGKLKTKKGPVDLGATCGFGIDCAAGVCVTDASKRYCSRECGPGDHCPPRFHCARPVAASSLAKLLGVCAES